MAGITTPPVVVGVDGSPSSIEALDYAVGWANRHRVSLRIVHAHMPPYAVLPYGAFVIVEPDEEVQASINAWLRKLAGKVRGEHPDLARVEVADAIGNAARVLIDESQHAAATLVGSRGLGGFAGLMLGSTSAHLAAHGQGPIIVVRSPKAVAPGGPVLACYDGSPASVAALRFAADEAELREVPLIVANVYDGDGPAAKQLLTEAIEPWAGDQRPIELRPIYSRHHPQYALLDASRDAALTVVGSRGHGLLASVLLGSVSRFMIHQAFGPVAVVHPAPQRKEGQ